MSSQSAVDDDLFRKLVLAVGFLAVGGSALVARSQPATGYELSIFTMTSPLVWAGLLVALSVGLAVTFVPSSGDCRGYRSTALVLSGLVMTVFAGLPIIRGYRFYGHYDALTHLGWARAISEGSMLPFDLFYPGIHTLTVLINSVFGIPLSRSLLLVVLLSVLVFCVFVPLSVGTITESKQAVSIAAFAAFLLLPITTISMYMEAHAMTQAVLFSALFIYLFTKYLQSDRGAATFTAVGILFALTSVATVVYHPQLVAHLIVAFVGICTVQYLARYTGRGGRMAEQTPVYGQAGFLVVLFLLWSSRHGFFGGTITYFANSVVEFALGDGGAAGDAVANQGASLAAIGGSVVEIFLKLFSPHAVFSLLAGGLVLGVLFSRNSHWFARIRAESTYFIVALIALVPLFFAYFFAPGSSMYFRVFGLMMVFVTILGSIALHGLVTRLSSRRADSSRGFGVGRPMLAVGFAVLLVLSLVAIFPTPYTYNASPHVSDTTMSGYEAAFESGDDDITYLGLRDGPNRYDDAINGNEDRSWAHQDVEADEFRQGLAGQYDESHYLVLTQVDYERETIAYQELRYTEAELDSVSGQPGVDRIQSNGEFDRYYVHGNSTAE